jgi:hypothetical protein
MSWQFVALVFCFVFAGVVLAITGHESMATFALGAGAGIVGQPWVNRVGVAEEVPPGPPASVG